MFRRLASWIAALAALSSCAATSSEDSAAESSELRRIGSPVPPPVGPVQVAPPPVNSTPPSDLITYFPDTVGSPNSIAMQWFNSDSTPGQSATIYRRVTDIYGDSGPDAAVYTQAAVPFGTNTWIDTGAVSNAQNCYYVMDTNGSGATAGTPIMCAYTRDGNNVRPARVQLGITVGPSYQNMTLDPVFVRLQDPVWAPRGNISWLAKDNEYLEYGSTHSFDLYTYQTVSDLTDITQITVGVAGADDLCIANMTLFVDYDGAPSSPYRVAFYKDFGSLPGGCATAVGSSPSADGGTQVQIGFQELRQSPDWAYQINQHVTNKTNHLPNFDGFFDGTATRGAIMGLAQNAIHAKGINMRIDNPIELTVQGNSVRRNNILTVKAHVHKDCDAFAQVDIRLVNKCDCVDGANAITETAIALENASAELEPWWSLCSIGAGVLGDITGLVTLGNWSFSDWLYDYLSGRVQAAIAGKTESTLPIAPPAGTQLEFRSEPSIYGGFGVAQGQVCDTYNAACSCKWMSNGYCAPD